MSNQDIIYDYILINQDGLYGENDFFTYPNIFDIANQILPNTSPSGKDYAILKFLQKYCTIHDKEHFNAFEIFCQGDPRKYPMLGKVRQNWNFKLKRVNNEAITNQDNENTNNRDSLDNRGESPTIPKDLIPYIAGNLQDEKQYRWKFNIRDTVAWLNPTKQKGETLEDSEKVLKIAECNLKRAIENNDKTLCFECVRLIMDWGGVYYPRGFITGNKQTIENLKNDEQLFKEVCKNHCNFLMRDTKGITRMNAGWTKVWAVLFSEKFIMFDSRVSYAFSKILKLYCKDNNIDQEDEYYIIPGLENYKQVNHPGRTEECFRKISSPTQWAESMLITSRILRLCLCYLKATGDSSFKDLRSIEARLFMMGGE